MQTITAILVFIMGTIIGSFLSAVVYRIRKKKDIIFARSISPYSGDPLKWYHMIPILSYIFLGGRCAYCGKKISIHYPVLELLTGLAFLAAYLNWNFVEALPGVSDPSIISYFMNWQVFEVFFYYIVQFSFLIGIFFYDLLYREIPDRLSLPAIGIAIAGALIFGTPTLGSMLMGGLVIFGFFFIQFILSKGRWIGGGDLRLGALMGLMLGFENAILAVIIAYLLGSVFSIILLATKKATRKTAIAFGPFLVIGTFVAIFYGDVILNYYFSFFSL